MPTSERADLSKVIPAVRCTARRQDGQPCKAMAARGANVCRVHGGSAPQVRNAAKRRLEQAADVLVQRLLGFAIDGDVPDAVALAAIRDALDRAGLSAKTQVEVEVGVRPFEKAFDGMARISRAESRRRRGLPDTPALAPATAEIVDAEIVEMPRAGAERPVAPTTLATEGDGRKRPPPWQGGPTPTKPPGNALVTLEEAAADMARDRSRTRRG